MKTRQSTLFENKAKESVQDIKLKRNRSYECVTDEIIEDKKIIPKLIFRRKKSTTLKDINKNNISKSWILNGDKKEHCIKENDKTIHFDPLILISPVKTVQIPQLPQEIISKRILNCSKLVKFINCENIYSNFLAKIGVNERQCWSELYTPKDSQYTLSSNLQNVSKIKRWLEAWKNVRQGDKTSKQPVCSDDSDFEMSFGENKKAPRLPPICIIKGACGVGKSSFVYTIAAELKYRVFEVNSGSRRTGKDVLDQLENAANNQHVSLKRTNEKMVPVRSVPVSFLKSTKRKSIANFFEPIVKKPKVEFIMKRQDSSLTLENCSLFLFDDVDVVMEEDKGFYTGICSLAEKQSRPIIVTITDSTELKKFVSKLGKIPYLVVSLEQNSFIDLAVYLQLILLSRGVEMEHRDILHWIHSFCLPTPDLRSCLHNMQFDFVTKQLRSDNRQRCIHWSRYKLSMLGSSNIKRDNENETSEVGYYGDENSMLSAVSEYHNDDKLPTKTLCFKGLQCISDKLNHLTRIDSQRFLYTSCKVKVQERHSTIDDLSDTYYDRSAELSSEIAETLTSLYNASFHKSLTKFETDILSTSPTTESVQVRKSESLLSSHLKVAQHRVTHASQIRSHVTGIRDHIDRWHALKTMAASENKRKNNCTQRRFHHYFNRINLQARDSDMNYLTSTYKNI